MRLLVAASAALCLAGCVTDKVDTALQKNLPTVCQAAAAGHVAFLLVAEVKTLPSKVLRDEATAWAGVYAICSDPEKVKTATGLNTALTLYGAIVKAGAEADKGG